MVEAEKQAFVANAKSKVLAKPLNMDHIITVNRDGSAKEIEFIDAKEVMNDSGGSGAALVAAGEGRGFVADSPTRQRRRQRSLLGLTPYALSLERLVASTRSAGQGRR